MLISVLDSLICLFVEGLIISGDLIPNYIFVFLFFSASQMSSGFGFKIFHAMSRLEIAAIVHYASPYKNNHFIICTLFANFEAKYRQAS
jgi:hypothetical protein